MTGARSRQLARGAERDSLTTSPSTRATRHESDPLGMDEAAHRPQHLDRGVERRGRRILLSDRDEPLGYDGLVITTGSSGLFEVKRGALIDPARR